MSNPQRKKRPTGGYEIGYAKPPQGTRFKQRRKLADLDKFDVAAIINEPVVMRAADGSAKKVSTFEVMLRGDVRRAIQERNMTSAARVLAVFEEHGALAVPKVEAGRGLIHARFDSLEVWLEFHDKLARYGYPPPWPDEDPDRWVGIVTLPDPRTQPGYKRRKKGNRT